MPELEYKLTNDILFKMMFVRHGGLLKRCVAELLGLRFKSIRKFEVTNPEMPPDVIGGKFCRLDVNMTVDGQRVDLEIQVADEGDFPERSLFYTKAIEAYREVSATAEFREIERQRFYAQHNEASALGHAHDLGKAEGIAEGIVKGMKKVVRNALRKNLSVREIARLTGLRAAEVRRLAGEKAGG